MIQKPSPNFNPGRSTHVPEAIVIHIMEGTLSGTDSWFASPTSQVSAHYGVGVTGEIHQYVKESDTAWHAGQIVPPTQWDFLGHGALNPNLYTIGIEHEGHATDIWPDAQKKASAALIKDICSRYSIPLDREHIVGHYQIKGTKPNCPAVDKGIIDELIALAKVGSPLPDLNSVRDLLQKALQALGESTS